MRKRHGALAVAIGLVLLMLGCRPIGMATFETAISGQVDMTPFRQARQTQATIGDVADAATVSLIDVTLNKTIGTSVTDTLGRFNLNFGSTFRPSSNTTYYLEAVKGLSSNKAGSTAARVRTLIRWQAGGWVSLTNALPGAVTVCRGTTAVAIIVSHRHGTARAYTDAQLQSLMGKVAYNVPDATLAPATTDTFNGAADYIDGITPKLTNAEFHGVWGMVDQAITDSRDPVGAISYDAAGNLFGLTTSAAPLLEAAPATGASVDDEVTLSGITFDAVRDNNVVTFNGVRATNTSISADRLTLKCKIPAGATTGPLTVTFNGQTFGLPSYTVLSTANITISAVR